MNLATGGNWAGDAGDNLAGQKYEIDYVYYGQNAQQKADSKEYYENAIKINGVSLDMRLIRVHSSYVTAIGFSI